MKQIRKIIPINGHFCQIYDMHNLTDLVGVNTIVIASPEVQRLQRVNPIRFISWFEIEINLFNTTGLLYLP